MNNLYLILHKVRGAPAFDIAERCEEMGTEDDPGPWWIIPTSGHRAHPAAWWELDGLRFGSHDFMTEAQQISLRGLPDHYLPKSSPAPTTQPPRSILAKLGLVKSDPLKRRKLT